LRCPRGPTCRSVRRRYRLRPNSRPESVPAAPETVEDAYDDYSEDEIIVTAPRLAGQLDTDIKAEAELDEAAIASYGVSNVSELLDALAPQTRSGRGRGGGRPIILVNGPPHRRLRRSAQPAARGDREGRSLPPKRSRCNMAIRPTSAS
jgi:hypothetical protein